MELQSLIRNYDICSGKRFCWVTNLACHYAVSYEKLVSQ